MKDEMCKCGHPKSQHEPSYGFIEGHGACKICGETKDGCLKFTWVSSIDR